MLGSQKCQALRHFESQIWKGEEEAVSCMISESTNGCILRQVFKEVGDVVVAKTESSGAQ